MSEPQKRDGERHTYCDYLSWAEDQRFELIEGTAYLVAAPSRLHQDISVRIFRQLADFFNTGECRVYYAPLDVRLPEEDEPDEEIETVIQPDILVVCDDSKLDDRGLRGAPDFVIEIISPQTATMDYIKKLNLYEKHGVKEYWIVHPTDRIVIQYCTQDDGYGRPSYFSEEDEIESTTFPRLSIELETIFLD